jgi:TolB-like protein
MPTAALDFEAVRRELQAVLTSLLFVRSEQLSRLLRFLVERHLEGRDEELKESVIAVEVFGRRPDYDPRRDPIVRTEARRLRARLADYYSQAPAPQVRIELPKGGYVPRIQQSVAEESDRPPEVPLKEESLRWHSRSVAALAVALIAVVAAPSGWWVFARGARPIPIAVLPLENLNHLAGDDYFADGLSEEIIRNLSMLDGLAVRSQTSSFVFKGKPRNIRDAARQLGVDYILEGSVLRAGEHLRVNVQLIRAREDAPIWSERYHRDLTDVFVIQDEISRGIVNSLRLKLGRGRRRYETSVAAYDLYLHGRELIRHSFSGFDQSVPFFEAAIAKDPSFAPAYAALAIDEAMRSGVLFDSAPSLTRMRTASEKAVELDPLSAEALTAQAFAYARDARWREAERSFRRAIELEPHNPMPRNHFALEFLEPLGRIDEALQELRAAEKDDPLSPEVYQRLANVLIVLGRYDEAVAYTMKMPPDSSLTDSWLGRARFFQGRTPDAIEILRRKPSPSASLGFVYGRSGRRAEAEEVAAHLENPSDQAIAFAGMGEKDRAVAALERATSLGPLRLGRVLVYPEMAILRGDPRVKAVRKKVGLPN